MVYVWGREQFSIPLVQKINVIQIFQRNYKNKGCLKHFPNSLF
jgi:hypothetical protein